MDLVEIKNLMELFDNSGMSYMSLEEGNLKIKLKKKSKDAIIKNDTPVIKKENKENDSSVTVVKAPLVGIYYESPSPEAERFVKEGDRVKKGQVLCLIEAMKMMNEVTAPKDGKISRIYLNNQDVAEFEAPLFDIED